MARRYIPKSAVLAEIEVGHDLYLIDGKEYVTMAKAAHMVKTSQQNFARYTKIFKHIPHPANVRRRLFLLDEVKAMGRVPGRGRWRKQETPQEPEIVGPFVPKAPIISNQTAPWPEWAFFGETALVPDYGMSRWFEVCPGLWLTLAPGMVFEFAHQQERPPE